MNVDQSGFVNQHEGYVTAGEAARLLDVKLATLYAYASRGLVARISAGRKRGHLYALADLERLRTKARARSGHAAAAASALRWGEPVLETSISAIGPEGPVYRGIPAVELARRGASFEAVAELLWTGTMPAAAPGWEPAGIGVPLRQLGDLVPRTSPPIAAMALFVSALGLRDGRRFGASPETEMTIARQLVARMAALPGVPASRAAVDAALKHSGVATILAHALGARRPARAAEALRPALVLSADHELNASTFAARVAASTGADIYSCVSAGLSTLSGPAHGGACDRVEALIAECGEPARARSVIEARSRRGEAIPGFGHTLYPAGDPRAAYLLNEARELRSGSPEVEILFALVAAMEAARRPLPGLDTGLVALSYGLGLPPGSASAIFAIGRVAGWVAHILEQREANFMIRPRAKAR